MSPDQLVMVAERWNIVLEQFTRTIILFLQRCGVIIIPDGLLHHDHHRHQHLHGLYGGQVSGQALPACRAGLF
jgi:hypothetical protein